MKIGSIEAKPIAPANASERKGASAPSGSAAEPSAQVELSSAASMLSGVGEDATFDTGKVQRIANAIREGKFQINAEAIADKLIVNAQELLGRRAS